VIFGRKKAVSSTSQTSSVEEQSATEADDVDEELVDDASDPIDQDATADPWVEFDLSADWREDGPFDIDEVDLDSDEVSRVDLGSLIITPDKGLTIKLVATPGGDPTHMIVENGPQSAMQITVFAAPADVNYAAQIRQELVDHTDNATVIEMEKGPFGTELRRVIAVSDEQGHEGFAPLRDWVISGPRWVLDVRLMGQAAVDSEGEGPAAQLEEFVRNLIVRRGDTAMVPGAAVPMKPQTTK
jgi:hypothetical protein